MLDSKYRGKLNVAHTKHESTRNMNQLTCARSGTKHLERIFKRESATESKRFRMDVQSNGCRDAEFREAEQHKLRLHVLFQLQCHAVEAVPKFSWVLPVCRIKMKVLSKNLRCNLDWNLDCETII